MASRKRASAKPRATKKKKQQEEIYVVAPPKSDLVLRTTYGSDANTANTANNEPDENEPDEGGGNSPDLGLLTSLMGMLNSIGLMNGGMGGWPVGISKNAEAGHGYPMSRRSVTTRQPEWRRKDKPTPSQWDAIVNDTAQSPVTSVSDQATGKGFDPKTDK